MEEVWKDINLSTLQQVMEANRTTTTTTTSFGGIIVQDLLAQLFKEPSPASSPFHDLSLPPSSGHLVGEPSPKNPNTNTNGGASPAGLFACCTKKRASEQQMEASFGNGNAADRRKKRLIKNREAAARSRARKQAYTQELEEEVAHLLDKNRKLKYEISLAVDQAQQPAKRTLQRASTAPF